MQRRTFIGAALATLATPYLPAAEPGFQIPDPVTSWNTETLTAALEQMFACQQGPVAPFFDMVGGVVKAIPKVEKPLPGFPNVKNEEFAEPTDGATRYRYETYACAIEGGDAKEAEVRLANHFYDAFSKLPAGALVWRVKPHFSTVENIKWGMTYCTRAAVEDGLVDLAALPEDAQYDVVNDSYRKVLQTTLLHKMRMRLVLPHLYDHEDETVAIPGLFKPEGAQITRML